MKALFWTLLLLTLATYLCQPIQDPDLWWHITVGKWILAHGEIPSVDLWNRFSGDKPWRAYSWITEVLFAWADSQGGVFGLISVKLSFGLLLVAALLMSYWSISRSLFLSGCLTILVVGASDTSFGLRPQTLSWGLLAILLALGEQIKHSGGKKRYLAGLFLCMVIWANTNITSALALGCLAVWLVDLQKFPQSLKAALPALAVGFLGTFFTPYLGAEWLTFFSKADHPLRFLSIAEFQPANFYHATADVVLLLLILFFIFVHHRPRALPLQYLLFVGGFFFLAMLIRKFNPQAAIVTASAIAALWRTAEPSSLGNIARGIVLAEEKFNKRSFQVVGSLLFVLAAAYNVVTVFQEPLDLNSVPKRAMDFFFEKELPLPLANGFGQGGYVMYRMSSKDGSPQYKVPIDGRTNVNDPEIMQLHDDALYLRENWEEYFRRTEAQSILWREGYATTTMLLESDKWCRVFTDKENSDTSLRLSLFVRREWLEQSPLSLPSDDCPQAS